MIEQILIPVAVSLLSTLGERAIKAFWPEAQRGTSPVVTRSGHLSHAVVGNSGQTQVRREATVRRNQAAETLYVRFFISQGLADALFGDELALVMVYDHASQEALLFAANVEGGCELFLPRGIYSVCAFLVDSEADDLYEAEIYALGLPSRYDMRRMESFTLDNADDVWQIVNDEPLQVASRGPFALDLIMLDPTVVDFPETFSDLIEDEVEEDPFEALPPAANLTGAWRMKGKYEFGRYVADVNLTQAGNMLSGIVVRHDHMNDGRQYVVQETVSGIVNGALVNFSAINGQILSGGDNFYADHWMGVIHSPQQITGQSIDDAGTAGKFTMERVMRGCR